MKGLRAAASFVALALLASSTVCVVALHVLRPDVEPAARRLSEYALGPYGYLMTAAFMTLGCALLALAVSLHFSGRARGLAHLVPAMIAVPGLAMIVSGLFETDPDSSSTAEIVHSRASGIAFVLLIAAALVRSLATRPAREHVRFTRLGAALAVTAAFVGLVSVPLHDTRWTGAGQRLLCLVLAAWVMLTARQLQVER